MIETVDRNEDWKISYSEFRVQQIFFLSIVFFNNRTVGTRMWDLNLGLKMFVLYFKGYHSTASFRALWFCVEANAPRQKCQECQFFLPQTLRAQFFQQKRTCSLALILSARVPIIPAIVADLLVNRVKFSHR